MRTPIPFFAVVCGVKYGYFDFVGCHVFHPSEDAPGGSYMSAGRGSSGFGAARRFVCRICTGGTMLQPNAVRHSAHAMGGNDQQKQVVFPAGFEPALVRF